MWFPRCASRSQVAAPMPMAPPGLPLSGVRALRRRQRTIPAVLGACQYRSSRDRCGSTDSGISPIWPCVMPMASRSSSRGRLAGVQGCDLEWIRAGRIQVAESETEPRRGSLQCTRWGGETLSLVAAGRMIGGLAVSGCICLSVRRGRGGRCRRDGRILQLSCEFKSQPSPSSHGWCGVTHGYPL